LSLIIPDEAVKFIRFQRSRYIERKVPDPEEVKRRYAAHVAEDYAGMEKYLPEKVEKILEIGCGVAAIQVFLKKRYPDAKLELLDADTVTAEGGAGYHHDKQELYNSRAVTERLLEANGVKVDKWHEVGTKELLEADLILSMASFGYHYPRSTYRIKGFAILDFRRGVEKMPEVGKIIFNGPKYDRIAFLANDA
jgi:hypothetical protein